MRKGVAAARSGRIVTFGIKPSRPETGYGYIEVEEGAVSQSEATDVRCFLEKPDLRTAEGFFQSGRHCWKAGSFLCSATTHLREMVRFSPATLKEAVLGGDGGRVSEE